MKHPECPALPHSSFYFHVQVDYEKRSVLRIVQLHQAPVNALAVHERTCYSGADDGQLRMWPLDFAHISLEASHAAPVTSVRSHDQLFGLALSRIGPAGH